MKVSGKSNVIFVCSYDATVSNSKAPPLGSNVSSVSKSSKSMPLDSQQFGVSLAFIKERNNGDVIPPILRQCVQYLSQPEGRTIIQA